MKTLDSLVGERFGRLEVLEKADNRGKHPYWKCICSCGNVKVIGQSNLREGKSKSCGCLRTEMSAQRLRDTERKNKLQTGVGSCNFLWNRYKQGAKKRGLLFEVDKDLFGKVTSSSCHYCGEPPKTIIKSPRGNGAYLFNGVDRKDSDQGYVAGNMLPCCTICNYAKNDMNYEDFQMWISSLVKFRNTVDRG